MPSPARLVPDQPVPQLRVKTVGGPCWRLCDQKPKHFTLILFHRGLHCPFCRAQLSDFERHYEEFVKLGIRVLAVSADDRERAERTAAMCGLDELTLCWGLGVDQAADWGLYLTPGRGEVIEGIAAPDWYIEPAMFFIRPDGRLFASVVQTMPIAQPRIDDVLSGVRLAIETGCPPPGTASVADCGDPACGCKTADSGC